MSILCPNGDLCVENIGFQSDCLIYYGPFCEVPCNVSACETEVVQDEQDCATWECQPSTTTPTPPSSSTGVEVAEILVPILALFLLVAIVIVCYKRNRDASPGHHLLGTYAKIIKILFFIYSNF